MHFQEALVIIQSSIAGSDSQLLVHYSIQQFICLNQRTDKDVYLNLKTEKAEYNSISDHTHC